MRSRLPNLLKNDQFLATLVVCIWAHIPIFGCCMHPKLGLIRLDIFQNINRSEAPFQIAELLVTAISNCTSAVTT